MMIDWTPDDIARQEATRTFAQSSLAQDLAKRDLDGASDDTAWRADWAQVAGQGLLGLHIDPSFGGAGLSIQSAIGVLEALGSACPDNGLTLAMNGQIWAVQQPILDFGSDAQKRAFLPGLVNGTILGAHALTEPDIGSDAMNLQTTATRKDGGYVLNGEKAYIGMGPACDVALVFANTKPADKAWGVSTFLVKATDTGFKRHAPDAKMGLRTVPTGSLTLQDCWIPEDRRLGAEGNGISVFQHTMLWERSFIFSSHVGAMARQLSECVAYAKTRRTFGKPIIDHQSVSNRLADMKVRLDAARMFLYRAAESQMTGTANVMDAAAAKLFISEAFAASSLDAVRIHGGRGYLSDAGIEHDLRDAVGGVLYSGTSDIQRQVIAKLL